jgi:hypothetical protein
VFNVKGKWIGIALIAMGALLLLKNVIRVDYDLTLFVIGGLFLLAYIAVQKGSRRNIGFLIPGSILTMLGVHQLLENLNWIPKELESMAPLVFIGLAFLLIYLASAAFGPKTAAWALLVGMIVLAMSALTFIVENRWIPADQLILYGLPVLLILVGFVILVRTMLDSRKHPNE